MNVMRRVMTGVEGMAALQGVGLLLVLPLWGCAHPVVPRDVAHARKISECLVSAGREDLLDPNGNWELTPECRDTWWAAAKEIEERSTCQADDDCSLVALWPVPYDACWLVGSKKIVNEELPRISHRVHASCGYFGGMCSDAPRVRCVEGKCRAPGYPRMNVPPETGCDTAPP